MFLEINGIVRNRRLIASVVTYELNGKFCILYKMQNGEQLVEEFNSETDRDAKYEKAVE